MKWFFRAFFIALGIFVAYYGFMGFLYWYTHYR